MTDLIILRDFLALCETKSFSRTAEQRYVSVSGLSRRIQGLEEWAGTALFERRKGELVLTEAGHSLQMVASQALALLIDFGSPLLMILTIRKGGYDFAHHTLWLRYFFPTGCRAYKRSSHRQHLALMN